MCFGCDFLDQSPFMSFLPFFVIATQTNGSLILTNNCQKFEN